MLVKFLCQTWFSFNILSWRCSINTYVIYHFMAWFLLLFLVFKSFMLKLRLLYFGLTRYFLWTLQFFLFFFILSLFCLLFFCFSYFFFFSHSLSTFLLWFHRFHKFMIIFSAAIIDYDYFHCWTRSHTNQSESFLSWPKYFLDRIFIQNEVLLIAHAAMACIINK